MLGWFLGLFVLLLGSLALLLRWALGPCVRSRWRSARWRRESNVVEWLAAARADRSRSQHGMRLKSERQRVERYRNTLGNLAHSLKTPLAVMRSTLAGEPANPRRHEIVDQQIDRMNAIVQHQLKRAAASGGAVVGQSAVEVAPLLVELRAALSKVYPHRDLLIEISVPEGAAFVRRSRRSVRAALVICSTMPASGADHACG